MIRFVISSYYLWVRSWKGQSFLDIDLNKFKIDKTHKYIF